MKIHQLPQLEMHVTHACDMQCPGCSHFCDLGYDRPLDVDEALGWLKGWSKRLAPDIFTLLGGEPLLQPELPRFIRAAAECFPGAQRRLVTNGLGLERWADRLPGLLKETGTQLTLSVYGRQKSRREKVRRALSIIRQWKRDYGLTTYHDTGDAVWRSNYQGQGVDMRPYEDGDPAKSFRACPKKACKTIHQGRLWLCPHLAYLPLVAGRLTHRELWAEALQYRPVDLDAPDGELEELLSDQPWSFCGGCPTRPNFNINLETADEMLPKSLYQQLLDWPEKDLRNLWAGWSKAVRGGRAAGFAFTAARRFQGLGPARPYGEIFDNNPALHGQERDGFKILAPAELTPDRKIIILVGDYAGVSEQLREAGFREYHDFLSHEIFFALQARFETGKTLLPSVLFLTEDLGEFKGEAELFFSRVDGLLRVEVEGPAANQALEHLRQKYAGRFEEAAKISPPEGPGWFDQLEAIYGGLETMNARQRREHFFQCLGRGARPLFRQGRLYRCRHSRTEAEGDSLDWLATPAFDLVRFALGGLSGEAPSFCASCYGRDPRLTVRLWRD